MSTWAAVDPVTGPTEAKEQEGCSFIQCMCTERHCRIELRQLQDHVLWYKDGERQNAIEAKRSENTVTECI